MVFIEGFRLIVVIIGAISGLEIGGNVSTSTHGPLVGMVLGALIAYILGGVAGRLLDKSIQNGIKTLVAVAPAEVFAASIIGTSGLLLGIVLGLPLIILVHSSLDFPAVTALAWILAAGGAQVGAMKGQQIIKAAGLAGRLSPRPVPLPSQALLLDSSAIMHKVTGVLGRSGLLDAGVAVPRFVLDQVITMVSSPDPLTAKRAKRGLEYLDTMRDMGVNVEIIEQEVPAYTDFNDKIVFLANEMGIRIGTCSFEIEELALQEGCKVLNLHHLGDELMPEHLPGERLKIDLIKEGTLPGQVVGYLPDGDMVVVNDATDLFGHKDIEVVVTSSRQTSQGILIFARLVSEFKQ